MEYSRGSYKIDYQNSQFDSIGELSWFLFMIETKITNNIISQPLLLKKDLPWYPDLSFSLFIPEFFKIYIEVKPLPKEKFDKELDLRKYKIRDGTTCICGLTNLDYLVISDNQKLKSHFDTHFIDGQLKWHTSKQIAEDFAFKYGTFNKSELQQKHTFVAVGKYKGFSFKELKQKDIEYYNWYIEKYDPIV